MTEERPALRSTARSRKRRPAFAKVNLGLAITGRRSDGYHELRSVFLRISMGDLLAESPEAPAAVDTLTVTGDQDCPVDGNIVLRAVGLLRTSLPGGSALPPIAFELNKEIPVAAGLGGGSSDGAAALRLAASIWDQHLAPDQLDGPAAQLGADVPFFLAGHAVALVSGIGDELRPIPGIEGNPGLLVVTPRERLSTADVFAAFDRDRAHSNSGAVVDELAAAFRAGMNAAALAGWGPRVRDANDLWPAAVRLLPSLERLRSELERVLDRPLLLTGSGSTLFALYPSPSRAHEEGIRLVSTGARELTGATVFAAGLDTNQDAWRIQ